eukprot:Pgem_evm1s15142
MNDSESNFTNNNFTGDDAGGDAEVNGFVIPPVLRYIFLCFAFGIAIHTYVKLYLKFKTDPNE